MTSFLFLSLALAPLLVVLALPRSAVAWALHPLRGPLERLWARYPCSYDWSAAVAGFLVCLSVLAGTVLAVWMTR